MRRVLVRIFYAFVFPAAWLSVCCHSFAASDAPTAPISLTVFKDILFFDGYGPAVSLATPPDVIRHRNDLNAKKLTEQQLRSLGSSLTMHVTVKAVCDNYDRIGNVNFALVPKGSASYSPPDVQRVEIGRFITPFMNKNLAPAQASYSFNVSNVARVFKDPALLAAYDIWIELEIFGVPYAAQKQIEGCAGRSDVFLGSLQFISTADGAAPAGRNFLLPLNFKKDLNNYAASATDVIGKTLRVIHFNLPTDVADASLYLITSNHGSNKDGEEYTRRLHHIEVDGQLRLTYMPGRESCEPFRHLNSQLNGIYGPTPRTPQEWQSFNNWCPGDAVPIRQISLGKLSAGAHTLKIEVPDAVFAEQQGYIPVSVYLQGSVQ